MISEHAQNRSRRAWLISQRGLTLVELMISVTLGLLVVLAATALLVSSKTSYTTMGDDTTVRDNARFAIENIGRTLRQAAFENWENETEAAPIVSRPKMSANLLGANGEDLAIKSEDGATTYFTISSTNNNDILAVRFFGAGTAGTGGTVTADALKKGGYGTVVDCLGMAVSAPVSQDKAANDRGWSIYYVGKDSAGEPALRCKAPADGKSSWNDEVIARGVESFQVLYGVDTDDRYLPLASGGTEKKINPESRIPNSYMTAKQIDALDVVAAGKAENKGKTLPEYTAWKRVSVVKVALLVRGTKNVEGGATATTYDLFGKDYSAANAANDPGVQIITSNLDASVQKRVRKVFLGTIQFRNVNEGSGDKDNAE